MKATYKKGQVEIRAEKTKLRVVSDSLTHCFWGRGLDRARKGLVSFRLGDGQGDSVGLTRCRRRPVGSLES